MKLKDRVAVVTGAGSGIGRATAIELASRGCHVALVDVNEAGAREAGERVAAKGVKSSVHVVDLVDRDAVRALPGHILSVHGAVHVLMNNAGIAAGGTFEQTSEQDFDLVMDVNFHALVRMTRAFLPHLRSSPVAQIVNVSSVYGLISPAGQTAYSASKFAVRGFSNALRHELEGSNVTVTVVHPGGVATSIARNARIAAGVSAAEVAERRRRVERQLRMPAERAARIIVDAIERRAPRVLVGDDAKIIALVERLMPVGYWKVLRKAFA